VPHVSAPYTEADPRANFREQEQARLRGEELNFAFVEPANDEIVLGGGSYDVDLEQSLRGRLLASAGGFHPADCQTPTPKAMSSRAAITSPQRRPASFGDPLGIHEKSVLRPRTAFLCLAFVSSFPDVSGADSLQGA
jgi:hypothetical protein